MDVFFGKASAEQNRLFNTLSLSEKIDRRKREFCSRRMRKEVLYVQIRFKETCLTGVRSNVQFYTRDSKIRTNPIHAGGTAICRLYAPRPIR